MLPREHRITRSQQFRAVLRGGARAGTDTVVVSVLLGAPPPRDAAGTTPPAWRCGFIVSKAVGNSVVRHRTQRRLRHLAGELVEELCADPAEGASSERPGRVDVVVRALPAAASADHQQLRADLASGLERALRKGRRHLRRTAARSESAGGAA